MVSTWRWSFHLISTITSFYRAPLGHCLFHVEDAEFQPADTVKNHFAGVFEALNTKMRRIHSKVLIYLKSIKTICEEVNSFTHPSLCMLRSFSQNTLRFLHEKRHWMYSSTISFRKYKRKGVLFVIYLFNCGSYKSSFFIAFEVILSTVFVKCLSKFLLSSFLAI